MGFTSSFAITPSTSSLMPVPTHSVMSQELRLTLKCWACRPVTSAPGKHLWWKKVQVTALWFLCWKRCGIGGVIALCFFVGIGVE